MPGSTCLVTNAHEKAGDLPEAADILPTDLPTKIV